MLRSKNLKAGKFCSATRHYVLQNMTFQIALLEGLYGLTVVRTVSLQTEILALWFTKFFQLWYCARAPSAGRSSAKIRRLRLFISF